MPMLYRLMFHMPMSSPHRIRMFGFFVGILVLPPGVQTPRALNDRLSAVDEELVAVHRLAASSGPADRKGDRGIVRKRRRIRRFETEPARGKPNGSQRPVSGQVSLLSAAYAVTDPSGHSRTTSSASCS